MKLDVLLASLPLLRLLNEVNMGGGRLVRRGSGNLKVRVNGAQG